METAALLLRIMTAVFVIVTLQAWWLGNEKRDVLALGVFAGLFGVGAATAALS